MPIPIYAELKKTLSESFLVSDGITKSESRLMSDTFAFDDNAELDFERTFPGESFNLSDSKTFQITKLRSETISLSDSRAMSIIHILAESYSLADDLEAVKLALKELTEVFNLADTYARTWEIGREYSESYSLGDSIGKAIQRAIAETINIVDDFLGAKITAKELTESINLIETKYFGIIKSLSEELVVSDGDFYNINRIFSENFSMSGALTKQEQRSMSEILNLAATRDLLMGKNMLEEIGLTGSITKSGTRSFSESMTITDSELNSMQRLLSEGINMDSLMSKQMTKLMSEDYAISDLIIRRIERSISESMNLSDGDTKQFYRLFLENIQASAVYSRAWNTGRTYSESLTLTDLKEIARLKELFETLNLSDGDNIINYIKVLSESFDMDDHFIKFLTSWMVSNSVRADIQGIIIDQGTTATLIRETGTNDNLGGVTAVSEEEYTIYMASQGILRTDRQMRDMGLALPGTERVFMFHEYPNSITGNGTLIPQVGDIIKDDEDIHWRIEEITAEREMDGSEIFKSALIKKFDLTQ